MVRILTAYNVPEAHLIKHKLENSGIACFLTNENITTILPLYNNMLGGGIQIYVDEKDVLEATTLLKDKIEPDTKRPVCPYCGSDEVSLGMGKWKGGKIFTMLLSILFSLPMGNLTPQYYCKNCKKEFHE